MGTPKNLQLGPAKRLLCHLKGKLERLLARGGKTIPVAFCSTNLTSSDSVAHNLVTDNTVMLT